MTKSPTDMFPHASWRDRLRRELRNPSMLTVGLGVLLVAAIPVAILLPGWVSTAQHSFKERHEAEQTRDESMPSISAVVPSQIAPWMIGQVDRMLSADAPYDWTQVSFKDGPCNPVNLSQLPAGKYAAAIAKACSDMDSIQARHARECPNAANCHFSQQAKDELTAVRTDIYEAFADSGFVLPPRTEQGVGP